MATLSYDWFCYRIKTDITAETRVLLGDRGAVVRHHHGGAKSVGRVDVTSFITDWPFAVMTEKVRQMANKLSQAVCHSESVSFRNNVTCKDVLYD